ncbi:MAG: HAMP domain-containing sensor histidine kinase [Dehalococcoidales bacterium]|nr:HAMP domain-containing sensor histidine kinase [Dehalococcoidales bacterium]
MIKAHQKGTLTVTSKHTPNVIRITFSDDGLGISRANMGRLFTPFFTTKKLGEGTGLGLSICLGIVSEHGGRLWAESMDGKGAAFIIELPAHRV